MAAILPFLPAIIGGVAGLADIIGSGATQGRQGIFGSPGGYQQVGRFTQPQQNLLSQLLQGTQSQLGPSFDFLSNILGQSPEAMQQFQAPALRQFREQIIPDIAQRFGEVGGLQSSGFQQALGLGAERLSENLAAQRANLGFQGLSSLQNLLGTALTPQFQYMQVPGTQGALSRLSTNLLGGFGLGGMR